MEKLFCSFFFLTGVLYGHSQDPLSQKSHFPKLDFQKVDFPKVDFPKLDFQNSVTLERSMSLKDCDSIKMFTFDIKAGTDIIKISAKSYLSSGDLSFTVFDPEGKRETGFSIGAGKDGKAGNGRLTHEIKPPVAGKWKVEIKAANATGHFEYSLNYK